MQVQEHLPLLIALFLTLTYFNDRKFGKIYSFVFTFPFCRVYFTLSFIVFIAKLEQIKDMLKVHGMYD